MSIGGMGEPESISRWSRRPSEARIAMDARRFGHHVRLLSGVHPRSRAVPGNPGRFYLIAVSILLTFTLAWRLLGLPMPTKPAENPE